MDYGMDLYLGCGVRVWCVCIETGPLMCELSPLLVPGAALICTLKFQYAILCCCAATTMAPESKLGRFRPPINTADLTLLAYWEAFAIIIGPRPDPAIIGPSICASAGHAISTMLIARLHGLRRAISVVRRDRSKLAFLSSSQSHSRVSKHHRSRVSDWLYGPEPVHTADVASSAKVRWLLE